jgi:uncharacterized protein (DUF1330 family)
MPKGYWIARMTVNDAEMYKDYVRTAAPAFQAHGARFLVRGGKNEAMEGPGRDRNVVIEFESYDKALACYNSSEYQAAVAIRQRCAEGELIVVEGAE